MQLLARMLHRFVPVPADLQHAINEVRVKVTIHRGELRYWIAAHTGDDTALRAAIARRRQWMRMATATGASLGVLLIAGALLVGWGD